MCWWTYQKAIIEWNNYCLLVVSIHKPEGVNILTDLIFMVKPALLSTILSNFMNVSGLTGPISPFCLQRWASTIVLSSYYFLGHHHWMTLSSPIHGLIRALLKSSSYSDTLSRMIWVTCVGLLFSIWECMSVDMQTKPVSPHRVTHQRYMMFMQWICLYKFETIPDTNYGQTYATDRYLNRRFWWVWIRQE